jgi:hypothetical protein
MFERLMLVVRKLSNLTPVAFADLVSAQWNLLVALWIVNHRPRGELLRPVAEPQSADSRRDEARLERLALAVDRVARFGLFRPTCLVRAVALERQIQHANAGPAVVRVGVAQVAGELLAHAWIELEGQVIGDEQARVRRFTPLHDFSARAR